MYITVLLSTPLVFVRSEPHQCLDKNDTDNVFNGEVLVNCNCDEEMDTHMMNHMHMYTAPGTEKEYTAAIWNVLPYNEVSQVGPIGGSTEDLDTIIHHM